MPDDGDVTRLPPVEKSSPTLLPGTSMAPSRPAAAWQPDSRSRPHHYLDLHNMPANIKQRTRWDP